MRAPRSALALLLVATSTLWGTGGGARTAEIDFPTLSGPVVDQAAVLSASTEQALDAELRAHRAAHGSQVVVVTLSTLGGRDIADYGFRLGRHWGIGDAARDDGVLLIVAPNEHAVRIEVGRGLEGVLTDALSRVIIEREILPRFRQGDVDGGVRSGVAAILATIGGEPYSPPTQDDFPIGVVIFLLFFLVFILVFVLKAGAVSMGSGGYRAGWGNHSGWGGGGLSGGGGFSSGGGFGGGGGGFSGGGASGRW